MLQQPGLLPPLILIGAARLWASNLHRLSSVLPSGPGEGLQRAAKGRKDLRLACLGQAFFEQTGLFATACSLCS